MDNETKAVLLKMLLTAGGDLGGKSVDKCIENMRENLGAPNLCDGLTEIIN